MPAEQIQFGSQASGLEELAGAPPLSVNALTDLSGAIRARPGISAWSDFPTEIPNASAVNSMAVFGDYLVYTTVDRKLWAWLGGGLVVPLSDTTSTTQLDGYSRPVPLSLRSRVVIAGGGAPQTWTGTGLSARLGGSPPLMAHVVGIATRVVGSRADRTGIFQWSGLGDSGHETWDELNYSEAEAKPDLLMALHDNTNEVFAFGAETLQVYSPDPYVGFAAGRTMRLGLLAPYSVINVDDVFAFLDRERRFVLTDGRGFSDADSVVSKPIEASLRGMSTTDDVWGTRLRTDRWDAGVWFFPTDGKGWIWDRRRNSWSEWRAWGSSGYTSPTITSAVYWPERNLFLVGLSTGQIAQLSQSAYTDLGSIIKVELVSGFIDHGTDNRKKCVSATFTFRRGETAFGGTAPPVLISWRDDTGAFGQPTVLDLGAAGDNEPFVEIRSSGVYRKRQWKVEFTSSALFSFVSAREDFVLLDN